MADRRDTSGVMKPRITAGKPCRMKIHRQPGTPNQEIDMHAAETGALMTKETGTATISPESAAARTRGRKPIRQIEDDNRKKAGFRHAE